MTNQLSILVHDKPLSHFRGTRFRNNAETQEILVGNSKLKYRGIIIFSINHACLQYRKYKMFNNGHEILKKKKKKTI